MVTFLEDLALVLEEEERVLVESVMSENHNQIQHFILTRFNLLLWNKDKEGGKVRTTKWLEHRFSLFEKYCLPSILSQTCQDFEWIVLFDSMTPEKFMSKIAEYEKRCPQLKPVFVEPERGRFFADIFRAVGKSQNHWGLVVVASVLEHPSIRLCGMFSLSVTVLVHCPHAGNNPNKASHVPGHELCKF